MHRIRADSGNALYYQKQDCPFAIPPSFPLTFPIPMVNPPALDNWSLITDNCFGPCAIAACGSKVYIFYRHSELNQLNKLYSHDYGQSWQDAQLVDYSEVASLAACWWVGPNPQSPTPIVVCFALKSSYPAELNGIVLDTSNQQTQQTPWYDSNHPLLDTYGIGATFNPFWPAIEIVLAGKESDTPYNHYDLFRTKFSDSYNFLALESFLVSPDGEDITYEYPDCHLPANAQDYETNRIAAVEKFVGTTAYTRPLTCHMVKGTYWSDTTFTEPKPFLDTTPHYGLRITSTTDYWWLSKPDGVWRAPRPAASPLDLTKDIISLTQTQQTQGTQRTLIIELNNSQGQYAQSQLLNKLNKRYELVLKLGYKTIAGNEAVEAGTYWINGWQYSITQQTQSTLTLFCLDGWGLMDRWAARYQMRWNKDDTNPKSVWQILYQLLARVGIRLTNTPPKPRSSAINNFYPDFTVNPGTQGTRALNKLLSFVPDQLVFHGQEAFTKNPLADESSCYSYSTNPTNSMHPIISGQYTHAVTISRSRAIGQDESANRIVQNAFDWDLLKLGVDILEQVYDPNLATTTRAQERADAILRTQQTQRTPATIVAPTNVGQELLDVVEVTDFRCGISEESYRVQAIHTAYDHRQGRYEQTLTLGAP
jgi:hypothetical protein